MLISVITTVRNGEAELEATLNSILAQEGVDVEIVVVDAASTDGSLAIVERMVKAHPGKFVCVSRPDSGIYEGINTGLALAKGDVIGTLHCGDRFASPRVLAAVAEAMNDGVPFVYGDVHFRSPSGKMTRYYSGRPFRPAMLLRGLMPPHPSLYMSRSAVDKVGPYRLDFSIAADFELMVRMMLKLGLAGRYVAMDMVEMSTGGISTRWSSRLWHNPRQKHRALLINSQPASYWSLMLRYLYLFKR